HAVLQVRHAARHPRPARPGAGGEGARVLLTTPGVRAGTCRTGGNRANAATPARRDPGRRTAAPAGTAATPEASGAATPPGTGTHQDIGRPRPQGPRDAGTRADLAGQDEQSPR